MRFLGLFGSAKDSVKEASSDATQIERLSNDSRHLARDMEGHLQHILHTVPKEMRPEEFRKLEAHLDITRRHAEQMRTHLQHLDNHIRQLDDHLTRAKSQAQHAQQYQKAA